MIFLDTTKAKTSASDYTEIDLTISLDSAESQHGQINFSSQLKLTGNLINEKGLIILNGLIEGQGEITCGSCLEFFKFPVKAEIMEIYYSQLSIGSQPNEEWVYYKGNTIDITSEVKKAVLLSLPMKIICKDDCKGLCSGCGHNLNLGKCSCNIEDIDIRLAVLKKLLD
ncbi:MAG: DUF177 domain-containing protein [Peptococcaceae bacterium]|nr:DUF177 domain-containing protein [Peptococcaceae bacterium]